MLFRSTKYDRPSVAADVVVFSVMKDDECEDVRRLQEKKLKILLIRRGGFPYKGSWAMPGGFCRKGEDVIDSARRELCEETGIGDAYVKLVGVYGEPGRDPSGWASIFWASSASIKESVRVCSPWLVV